MYRYRPAVITRLLAALDRACEEYRAVVHIGLLAELHEMWRVGLPSAAPAAKAKRTPESALVRRRRTYGIGMGGSGTGSAIAIPKGRPVAVAWREAVGAVTAADFDREPDEGEDEQDEQERGSRPHLLIGEWVWSAAEADTDEGDALTRRAANSIPLLVHYAVSGREHERQQGAAIAHEGGVALIRQQPKAIIELWDVGEERTA